MKLIQKGFTLIELLIVIAVIGVLAAVVLVAIDPVDRINAANDAKAQSDMSMLGSALATYAVDNATATDIYPTTLAGLTAAATGQQLRSIPTAPATCGSATYNYVRAGAGTSETVTMSCVLKSKKYTATPKLLYESGKLCTVIASATTCP